VLLLAYCRLASPTSGHPQRNEDLESAVAVHRERAEKPLSSSKMHLFDVDRVLRTEWVLDPNYSSVFAWASISTQLVNVNKSPYCRGTT
jgi:hypothetical protein